MRVEIIPASMFVEGTIFKRKNLREDLAKALQWKSDLALKEHANEMNISKIAKALQDAEAEAKAAGVVQVYPV